jgi:hypothetical protein
VEGAASVALHARTAADYYSGTAPLTSTVGVDHANFRDAQLTAWNVDFDDAQSTGRRHRRRRRRAGRVGRCGRRPGDLGGCSASPLSSRST